MDNFEVLIQELNRRDILMQQSLNKIDTHLEKLNGKVAEHEKIINQNIPHNISLCPQQETIVEIHDTVTKLSAIKEERKHDSVHHWQKIGVVVMILSVIIASIVGFRNSNKQYVKMRDELKEDIRVSTQPAMLSRGGMFYDPVDGRTYLFDSVKVYKLDSLMKIISRNVPVQ